MENKKLMWLVILIFSVVIFFGFLLIGFLGLIYWKFVMEVPNQYPPYYPYPNKYPPAPPQESGKC